MMLESQEGKILIAHPGCPKDNPFHKSVVYIYQDNPGGTIGVIINKPSRFTVQDICADKKIVFLNKTPSVYHGGPVNPNALILLHSNDWHSENTISAGQDMLVSSDNVMLKRIAEGQEPKQWKLYGGMAAWQAGQLKQELSGRWPYRPENSWLIASVPNDFIFRVNYKHQWQMAVDLSSRQMFEKYF